MIQAEGHLVHLKSQKIVDHSTSHLGCPEGEVPTLEMPKVVTLSFLSGLPHTLLLHGEFHGVEPCRFCNRIDIIPSASRARIIQIGATSSLAIAPNCRVRSRSSSSVAQNVGSPT
jgi:hypothetical protein